MENKGLRDILLFENMLTPKVITVLYWVGLLGILIAGVVAMFAANFFAGLVTILAGAVGWRIWCELIIVLFKINSNLQRLADKE